ncbi:MAG TPA: hypothetical protein VFL98_02725 [Candidatus Paceibacterota bacterium]|nr:hypothetical protein [Candidatus Paceibacterota bacterium]
MMTRTALRLAFAGTLLAATLALPLSALAQANTSATTVTPSADAQAAQDAVNKLISQSSGAQGGLTGGNLLRDGVFGCQAGQYAMPVGTLTAIGGTYVPVNDAAVTENTGYLVYKECVLDGVVVNYRQSATADIVRQITKAVNTGNNGGPQFVTNLGNREATIYAQRGLDFLQHDTDTLNPLFKDAVLNASAQQFYAQINGAATPFSGTPGYDPNDIYGSLWNVANNPSNVPIIAYVQLNQARDSAASQAVGLDINQLEYNNGFISQQKSVQVPTADGGTRTEQEVVTPGYVISQILTQALGSGYRQLESANQVNEIISSVFSGLTDQVLSGTDGLLGIGQSQNGQPSYLDQMVTDASSQLQSSVIDSALTILNQALATEQQFYDARKATDDYLDAETTKLDDAQDACWVSIEKAVQGAAGGAGGYTVATTTEFADAEIAKDITPVKTLIDKDASLSTTTIAALTALLANINTSGSPTMQRIALGQLDALVANKALHSAYDVKTAQQNQADIQNTIGTTVDATIASWAKDGNWCDTTDQSVVSGWLAKWRQ